MMMKWIVPSLISAIVIGGYNLYIEFIGKKISGDPIMKTVIVLMLLTVCGIVALVMLIVLHTTYPSTISKLQRIFKGSLWRYLLPGGLIVVYMISNILALSEGGGIVMAVIGLSIFITLFGGVIFLDDKLNINIILSSIIATALIAYASYESSIINK